MYKLTSSILETIKTFCISIICSVIFSLMIYRDNVLINPVVCFVLNLTSFILFLFLYYKNWFRTYMRSFSSADYWVSAIISYVIFCGVSTYLYVIKASNIFPWFFQQTRFLEPMLNKEYKYISFILSQILTLITIAIIPVAHSERT